MTDPLISGAQLPALRRALRYPAEPLDRGRSAALPPKEGIPITKRKWMTGAYWVDTLERTVRDASGAALAALTADTVGLFDVDWPDVGALAGMAAVVSLLTSLVAGATGDATTAGFLTSRRPLTQRTPSL